MANPPEKEIHMKKEYPKAPVIATVHDNPSTPRTLKLTGKVSRTIRALVDKGAYGITALEMSNTWALRIADYVHTLRHTHNISILMVKEPHEGGWHARYVLQSNITLQEPETEV